MKIPKHIVLFPDGNRRWAKHHKVSIQKGYLRGKDKFDSFLSWCKNRGIKTVTVFGFSSENWKRPKNQVNFLMNLFEKYLKKGIEQFKKEGVKVKIIGERDKLPKSLQFVIEEVERKTKKNRNVYLNLAVSYGGKWDIVHAVKKIIKDKIKPEQLTEKLFNQYLSMADLPAPDLIIRAGGQIRLSNFILWQSAYAELYFSPKLWPDFTEHDLDIALRDFDKRIRKFGE